MTQVELADAAGLARPFVNRLERGHAGVAVETIGALATALDISPVQLISSGD
jgi:transcriptional regulator with XRE-family HTH domain